MLHNVSKIGIIGGGISGLYLAYLLKDTQNEIILFERNKSLGGRISSTNHDGKMIDQGAEYYIEDNKYLRKLIQELDLKEEEYVTKRFLVDLKNKSGLHLSSKKDNFITKLSKSLSLLRNFGLKESKSLSILNGIATDTQDDINEFYIIMEQSSSENLFENLYEFFKSKGTLELNAYDYLVELGVSDKIIWEFVNPIIRNVYMTEVNELPAYLAQLLFALKDKTLFHVKGGNLRIVQELETKLLKSSVSIYKSTKVTDIMESPTGDFVIHAEQNEISSIWKDFDFLFISGPMAILSKIAFSQFGSTFMKSIGYYGKIPYKQFYHHLAEVRFEDQLIENGSIKSDTIIPSDRITSIWEINVIEKKTDTWVVDITSPYDVEKVKSNSIFSGFRLIKTKKWQFAYPDYSQLAAFEFPKNHLIHPRLYIGTDNLISTLESSIIQADKCSKYIQNLKKIAI